MDSRRDVADSQPPLAEFAVILPIQKTSPVRNLPYSLSPTWYFLKPLRKQKKKSQHPEDSQRNNAVDLCIVPEITRDQLQPSSFQTVTEGVLVYSPSLTLGLWEENIDMVKMTQWPK